MTGMIRLAPALAAALLLAACGTAGYVTPNGAADASVSLLSLTYSVVGRPGGDQLVELTKRVAQTSGGSITLVAGAAPDSSKPDTSADTIAAVADGKAQLGIVSARTFDTLGVTSFQALQAPYLVTSNELADKVLADPLADQMLAGTDKLGVVGVGLAFDSLAYPGGFGSPVLSPQDYAGHKFQVRPSKANDLLAAALGATSDPRNGPELAAAVSAGEVRGSWGYFDAPTQPVEGEVFTGNEPAFARANVIIVNKKVYDGLSDRQKDELRAAAAQTRDWMAGRHTDPAATAAAYCSQANGTIAISSADDLAAMHAATAPVIAQLQSDPLSAQVIARIRELAKSVTPPATPLACAPGSVTRLPMPVLAPKGDQGALDGVWRLTIKGSTLIAAGATQVDAANNEGVWTWTFAGGKLQTVEPGGTSCDATYTLDGTRFLSVVPLPIGCEHVWSFTMVRSGDKLTVSQPANVLSGSPIEGDATHYEPDPQSVTFYNAFFHEPMVRVGDAP